jgi:alpha-glucosidase (family GH31 glycosyl hydrolase)
MFPRDQSSNGEPYNLYGMHPFYLNIENGGNANGVLLMNSHAMHVQIQPEQALTYRLNGGNLDFSIFLGPSPQAVIESYVQVIFQIGTQIINKIIKIR